MSPSELRDYCSKKNGKALIFISEFPTIGRGNVLRNNLVSGEKLNKDIDRLLKK
jgi:hypothetical protein